MDGQIKEMEALLSQMQRELQESRASNQSLRQQAAENQKLTAKDLQVDPSAAQQLQEER